MIFNSVAYLLFLLTAVSLWWVLPRRPRLWLIFLSSLAFYSFWRIEFLPIILFSTVIDYVAAIRIDAAGAARKRTRLIWLLVSLFVNLGLLFYFKYLLFFTQGVFSLLNLFGAEAAVPVWEVILPLGISFYTFQTISYTVDVYRGFIKPEKDFVLYADYVTFFPQLVAGPILRAREVIHQISERRPFVLSHIGRGLRRVLYGLFLKVLLADHLAGFVDLGFSTETSALSAIDVMTLAFLFGFQIYFDFSAYSHIAIGSARMMGIDLPENFNFPYIATSPRDFWRRWHISLSSWIRDYLYLPLGGGKVEDRSTGGLAGAASRQPLPHPTRAVFLTWAIMGLWHGAAWSFVVWGLWHAVFIYLYRLLLPSLGRLPRFVRSLGGWVLTLAVAMLGWIPFRAGDFQQMLEMYGRLFDPAAFLKLGLVEDSYLLAATMLICFVASHAVHKYVVPRLNRHAVTRCGMESLTFAVIVLAVFIFLRPIRQYIYFEF